MAKLDTADVAVSIDENAMIEEMIIREIGLQIEEFKQKIRRILPAERDVGYVIRICEKEVDKLYRDLKSGNIQIKVFCDGINQIINRLMKESEGSQPSIFNLNVSAIYEHLMQCRGEIALISSTLKKIFDEGVLASHTRLISRHGGNVLSHHPSVIDRRHEQESITAPLPENKQWNSLSVEELDTQLGAAFDDWKEHTAKTETAKKTCDALKKLKLGKWYTVDQFHAITGGKKSDHSSKLALLYMKKNSNNFTNEGTTAFRIIFEERTRKSRGTPSHSYTTTSGGRIKLVCTVTSD